MSRPSSGSRAWRRAAIGWLLTIASLASNAGLPRYCEPPPDLSAAQRDSLLRVADVVRQELQRSGTSAALVSRSGLDLRRLGARYSHAGIGLASSPSVPWSVRQLYFDCDQQRARLFDQGLAGFVLGQHDPRVGFISLVLMPEAAAQTLAEAALDERRALSLLGSRYSANAYAYATQYQNCNQWVAELMAAAWGDLKPAAAGPPARSSELRVQAQQWLREAAYRPSSLTPRPRALALVVPFVPWFHLDDHPEASLGAQVFEVSMPASLEAFVRQREPSATRVEICHTPQHIVLRRSWAPLNDACVPEPGDELILLR